MAREIGRDLELPTEVFNPLTCCTLGSDLRRHMPEHPSRFASLVGMLLDESAPGIATIDFSTRVASLRGLPGGANTIAGAAAAALSAIALLWIWFSMSSLDSQIADLSTVYNQKEAEAKQKSDFVKRAAEIDKWLGAEVNWLDELATLSVKAPPPQDLMLTLLTTPSDYAKNTSNIHLEGLARSTSVVEQLPRASRDSRHDVSSKSAQEMENPKKNIRGR